MLTSLVAYYFVATWTVNASFHAKTSKFVCFMKKGETVAKTELFVTVFSFKLWRINSVFTTVLLGRNLGRSVAKIKKIFSIKNSGPCFHAAAS